MARYRGTTAERGLGTEHMADKKRLLAQHRDGDPCWRCGQPMFKAQALERDHVIDRAHGGHDGPAVLAHRSCNRAAGARLGNHLQPRVIMAAGRDTICRGCGKPYHYAARACEVCGAHYHPNGGQQRSCSRACGVVLKQRNRQAKGWVPKAQRPKPAPKPKPVRELPAPSSPVVYYTCRYCRKVGVTKVTGQSREVCPDRACQALRLQANNWRVRYGLTEAEANAEISASASAYNGSRSLLHICPTCGERTAQHRWCDACLCTSVNAKGKRCGNVASADGKCEHHANATLASSRQW